MIDVHCHMQFHSFQKDYDDVIKRAFDDGITRIINTGTQVSSSKTAVELADTYENLFAIVGVHPHHADKLIQVRQAKEDEADGKKIPHQIRNDPELPTDWIEELEKLAIHPKVVGIGEIGMDYYPYASNGVVDPKLQKEVFEKQIHLAHRTGLPLQIHNRQAGEDIIKMLQKNQHFLLKIPGMFHCFAGSYDVHKAALGMGFYIGFDGNTTYPGIAKGETTDLKEIALRTPLDRIVIETDSPFLTPIPHRGKRNEPRHAILTGQFIADLKGISYSSLVEQTTKNVYTIFTKMS
jgi:TatD DNase family protein